MCDGAFFPQIPRTSSDARIACRIVVYGQARPRRESLRARRGLSPGEAVAYLTRVGIVRGLRCLKQERAGKVAACST